MLPTIEYSKEYPKRIPDYIIWSSEYLRSVVSIVGIFSLVVHD